MRKTFNKNLQRGFTLVELLLYMGVFSILLVVLLELFGTILSTHVESQATSSVDQDGSFILSRLTYDIHNSSLVTNPTLGNSCTATPIDTSCKLELSATIYELNVDADGNVNLLLTANENPSEQLNSKNTEMKEITFRTLGNSVANAKPSVELQFTLKSKALRTGGQPQMQTFKTTVGTR